MIEFRRLSALPEIIEVTPQKFGDDRGYFSEVFCRDQLEAKGIKVDWIQDNQSLSVRAGTVRGLHLQLAPKAQDKLIRVLKGAIYDVAVDVRVGSRTYGRWIGLALSATVGNQLFIPKGFAHGFMTTEPDTEVLYKVSSPYSPDDERSISWDDPDVSITWPLKAAAILSPKDEAAQRLCDQAPMFELGKI